MSNGTFRADVVTPGGTKVDVPVTRTADGFRGSFPRTDVPGEYRLVVHGEGRDEATDDANKTISGEASARFLVYDDDVELTKGGADYNLRLSQQRAEAVRDFLVRQFAIEPKRLVAKGFGQRHLKDQQNPLDAKNRRVQIVNFTPPSRQ